MTVNLQQSQAVRTLTGTIAVPSSGTNTATVNLVGAGTNLMRCCAVRTNKLCGHHRGGRKCLSLPSVISGSPHADVPAGNNTYSGTTTVGERCSLVIDGNTSGQGITRFLQAQLPGATPTPTLSEKRTIGLAANGTITVGGNLAPGPASGIGTLHVNTSGTGESFFGDGSIFVVQVSSASSSDLLAITGGSINLTSSSDTLSLSSLAGAFDGTDYTIATFAQNAADSALKYRPRLRPPTGVPCKV